RLARLEDVYAGDGVALGDDLHAELAALAVRRARPRLSALARHARRRLLAFRRTADKRQRAAERGDGTAGDEVPARKIRHGFLLGFSNAVRDRSSLFSRIDATTKKRPSASPQRFEPPQNPLFPPLKLQG